MDLHKSVHRQRPPFGMCVKAPSSALSLSSWRTVPDPDGMNRWVAILASLVTDHPDSQP